MKIIKIIEPHCKENIKERKQRHHYYVVLFRPDVGVGTGGDLRVACVFDEPGYITMTPADLRFPIDLREDMGSPVIYEKQLRQAIAAWKEKNDDPA